MPHIQLYHNDQLDIDVYIDTTSGETYQSTRGLAELLGVHTPTITRKLNELNGFEGVAQNQVLEAEALTAGGVQGVALIPEQLVICIAEYYAYEAGRYKTEKAKEFFRTISQAGLRAYHYTVAGYKFNVQPKVKALDVPGYKPARKKCMDKLKDHGAKGYTYASVESYNNALNKVENGQRHQITREQVQGLTINYQAATIELLEREKGFAKNQRHLQNTTKKAMRIETYKQVGEDQVCDSLKPRHERRAINPA